MSEKTTMHVAVETEDYRRIPDAVAKEFRGAPVNRTAFARWAIRRALDEILGPPPKNAKAGKKPAQVAK